MARKFDERVPFPGQKIVIKKRPTPKVKTEKLPPVDKMPELMEQLEVAQKKLLGDRNRKMTRGLFHALTSELAGIYVKIMKEDLEQALSALMENSLWNNCFKMPLQQLVKGDTVLFTYVLEASLGFYFNLVKDLGIHFNIPCLGGPTYSPYLMRASLKEEIKNIPSSSSTAYIIQNSMVHIGDIFRYRGSFDDAFEIYEISTRYLPSDGHPFNQLGLVQLLIDDSSLSSYLDSVYYHVRSLCTQKPFIHSETNLENSLLRTTRCTPQSDLDEFIMVFIKNLKTPGIAIQHQLVPLVKQGSVTFQQLLKIFVIAFWSCKEEKDSLDLVVYLINGVLQVQAEDEKDKHSHVYIVILKLAIDWIRHDMRCDEEFLGKLDTGILDNIMKSIPLEEPEVDGVEDLLLSEEQNLLGFLPLNGAYEKLKTLIHDSNPNAKKLRMSRLLKSYNAIFNKSEDIVDCAKDVKVEFDDILAGFQSDELIAAQPIQQSELKHSETKLHDKLGGDCPALVFESNSLPMKNEVPLLSELETMTLEDKINKFTSLSFSSSSETMLKDSGTTDEGGPSIERRDQGVLQQRARSRGRNVALESIFQLSPRETSNSDTPRSSLTTKEDSPTGGTNETRDPVKPQTSPPTLPTKQNEETGTNISEDPATSISTEPLPGARSDLSGLFSSIWSPTGSNSGENPWEG